MVEMVEVLGTGAWWVIHRGGLGKGEVEVEGWGMEDGGWVMDAWVGCGR